MDWLEFLFETVFFLSEIPWWKNSNNKSNPEKTRTNEQLVMDRYCVTRRILDPNYLPKLKQKENEEKLQEYIKYIDGLIAFAKKGNEAIPNEKYFNHVTYGQYFKKLNKLKNKKK